MSKEILVLSYATFPSNSPRHLRTHELVRELSKQGHKVTLYVLKGNYNYKKYEEENNIEVKSLGKTVFFNFDPITGLKEPIVFKIVRKFLGSYLEFPLIELVVNVFNVLKKENQKDLLITIGNPYPLHWGAALFMHFSKKNKFNKWIADCGDPYMGNDFHKKPFYFKYIEKFFCRKTDFITIPIHSAIEGYYPEFHNKIRVIPQGFNFSETKIVKDFVKNEIPTFIYAGIFYEKLRDPRPLLDYLIDLKVDFKFKVYTKNKLFLEKYITISPERIEVLDYIPRDELIFEMSKADFLINIENPSHVHSPSKLIDYALSKRPILSLNTNDKLDKRLINDFLQGNYDRALSVPNIDIYDIKNVARKFIELVD